jgi:2-polyprenyl-6-hydroxyphenyl methylase/3-demethylubiquinone-9 3-methyltransferase
MLEFAADPGIVFFTTYARPADSEQLGMNWWYIAPRNGHVSIFTKQALTFAFERHGYKFASFSDNVHLAFRTLPPFLAHVQKKATGSGDPPKE